LGVELDFSLPANLQTADMSGGGMVPISLQRRLAVFLNSGSFARKSIGRERAVDDGPNMGVGAQSEKWTKRPQQKDAPLICGFQRVCKF
jgi:hypothetical protein